MAKQFLLGPAHVVYLFVFLFTLIFLFASCGHSVALFALLHTSNPLTSADNVNCLPPLGTLAVQTATPSPFSSLLPPLCKRSLCVFLFKCDSFDRLCMGATVCDTNDKSLSECITCTIRTFPILIFCLSAGVSVSTHSLTGTICCHTSSHLIFNHRARFQCTVLT